MTPRKLSMVKTTVTLDDILKAYPIQNHIWAPVRGIIYKSDCKLFTYDDLYNQRDPWFRVFKDVWQTYIGLTKYSTTVEGVYVDCVVYTRNI